MPDSKFTPAQAEELATAFAENGVDYLFIGKSGAILLGYPDTTQDVDVFLPQSRENAERVLLALRSLGFRLDAVTTISVLTGSEIILLKGGPFALDPFMRRTALTASKRRKPDALLRASFRLRHWTTLSRANGRRAARRMFRTLSASNNSRPSICAKNTPESLERHGSVSRKRD
jgi:hypothetical protein